MCLLLGWNHPLHPPKKSVWQHKYSCIILVLILQLFRIELIQSNLNDVIRALFTQLSSNNKTIKTILSKPLVSKHDTRTLNSSLFLLFLHLYISVGLPVVLHAAYSIHFVFAEIRRQQHQIEWKRETFRWVSYESFQYHWTFTSLIDYFKMVGGSEYFILYANANTHSHSLGEVMKRNAHTHISIHTHAHNIHILSML